MREIEIKARVDGKKEVLKKLKGLGVMLTEPIKQHDVVYGQPGMKGGEQESIWLRIRTENDKTVIFTLKMSVVGHLDSIEHELHVSDAHELEAIIQLLGFELYSDLTKIRSKGKLGSIEICVDNIPELGDFIEAEMLMEKDADHERVVEELWKVFGRLGVKKINEVHEGYDVLQRKKRGLDWS